MNEIQQKVLFDVKAERDYQDKKWNTPDRPDTTAETTESFIGYIQEYSQGKGRAANYDVRTRLIKTAALAVAAVERLDKLAAGG